MSDTFYTNVAVYGSRILFRGIENGRKIRQKIDYHPTLYLTSKTPTEFTTITGEYVSEIKPGNIRDCRDFVDKYKDVDNFKIYGNQKYEYAFIADNYPDDIHWDRSLINVANIDIEVGSEEGNGFPEPSTAREPVTAITFSSNGKFFAYGIGDFSHSRNDLRYSRCDNEIDLLKRFISDWSLDYPDIVTGYNLKFFDIPYLVNRITKVLGEDYAKRLSPWNVINQRKTLLMGKDQETYTLLGISTLDYIELYRKFAPEGQSQESYKLDNICHVELGERKLSYEEYGNLHTLLSKKSNNLVIPDDKPNCELKDFEKWVRLKNNLEKSIK
jgi:DNA polymerase elongation subunit (family B)